MIDERKKKQRERKRVRRKKREEKKRSGATSNLNAKMDHTFALISDTLDRGATGRCWNSDELFFHRIPIAK